MAVSTTTKTNATFRYPTLHSTDRSFRIFHFRGRDEDGVLSGNLEIRTLKRPGEYVALSYEWGDDEPTHRILLDKQSFFIRKNLHSFLSSRTMAMKPGKGIFIDALCINQADLDERNAQVRLMSTIYSQASEVRAWLGPMPTWWKANPRFSEAFTIVPRRELGNFAFYIVTIRRPGAPLPFTISNIREWARNSGLGERTILLARVAAQRPFWKRVWIVQELLLARKLTLILDDRVLDPDVVLGVSRAMCGYFDQADADGRLAEITPSPIASASSDDINDGLRFQDAAVLLTRKRNSDGQVPKQKLYEVLDAFALQQCREPRDHVFGLLGLCESNLRPHYDIPLPQLFLYATMEAHQELLLDESMTISKAGAKAAAPVMTAFDWSMSNITVHLLTRQALRRSSNPAWDAFILSFSLWHAASTLNRRKWPRILRWPLEILQLVLLVILPLNWWLSVYDELGEIRRRSPLVLALTPTELAYFAHLALLALLGWLDWELVAPDGQIRTLSGWCEEVERIKMLVRNGESVLPLSEEERAIYYPNTTDKLRTLRCNLAAGAGIVFPLVGRLAGWAVLGMLLYIAYSSSRTMLLPYCGEEFVESVIDWIPGWKTCLALYVAFRVYGMKSTFPAKLKMKM